ncbi:MAG: YebC/PmpR family DNA-binding transcriptional regulator [Planctomycetota bacterium]|jgi:YebC/PmpR family DNA-binding regulatory protein
MSGHSHWAKIKRAKAGNDAKRGREWSKLARRIIVAAKSGGNPDDNLTLRYAIDDAKAANMPNDTIDKAIKKGTGELGAQSYEQIVYEGYGPGGVAFMVDCLTDNRNRTAPEVRKIFEKAGGQLGATGCVAYLFKQRGRFVISAEQADEDTLMEIAIDAGADDVRPEGDLFEITCDVPSFSGLKAALADREIETIEGEIAMVPDTTILVSADKVRQVTGLEEAFEDHDDVQKVYANFEIPEDVLADLEQEAGA